MQGRVVQTELGQCIAQRLVIRRAGRVQSGEDLRLDRLETRQGHFRRMVRVSQGIADGRSVNLFDPSHDKTDLAGSQHVSALGLGCEDTHRIHQVGAPRGHDLNLLARRQCPLLHTHQGDDAKVVVEPRIDDERRERRVRVARGRRNANNDLFQ